MVARARRTGLLALALLFAASLSGCFDDPTEIVIAVDTDAIPMQDFSQIQFMLSQGQQSFADSSTLPATLGVTRSGPTTEFDVTVTLNTGSPFGQGTVTPFVTRKASHVKFAPDQMKVLFLPLFRACACIVDSMPSTTCAHALDPECRDITVPVLSDFDEDNIPRLPASARRASGPAEGRPGGDGRSLREETGKAGGKGRETGGDGRRREERQGGLSVRVCAHSFMRAANAGPPP